MLFDRNNIRNSILNRVPDLISLESEIGNEFIFLREFAILLANTPEKSELFINLIQVINDMCSDNDPEVANFAQVGIFEHLVDYPDSIEKIESRLNSQSSALLKRTMGYIR